MVYKPLKSITTTTCDFYALPSRHPRETLATGTGNREQGTGIRDQGSGSVIKGRISSAREELPLSSNPIPVNRSTPSSADRPTLEEVIAEAKAAGLDPEAGSAWHAEAEAVGWISRGGVPVMDWRAALRGYRLRKGTHTAEKKASKPGASLMSREIQETTHIKSATA